MSDEEASDVDFDAESTGSNESDIPDDAPIEEYVQEEEEEEGIPDDVPPTLQVMPSLLSMHPQEKHVGYDEVLYKCTIQRDEYKRIKDPLHTTLPFLSKYEFAKVIGMRAAQIENGAALFVSLEDSVHDPFVIAKEELKQKKIPFILKRPIPNGNIEYWKLSDLDILA